MSLSLAQRLLITIATGVLLLLASSAQAQPPNRGPGFQPPKGPSGFQADPGRIFDRMDADNDGVVSKAEFVKAYTRFHRSPGAAMHGNGLRDGRRAWPGPHHLGQRGDFFSHARPPMMAGPQRFGRGPTGAQFAPRGRSPYAAAMMRHRLSDPKAATGPQARQHRGRPTAKPAGKVCPPDCKGDCPQCPITKMPGAKKPGPDAKKPGPDAKKPGPDAKKGKRPEKPHPEARRPATADRPQRPEARRPEAGERPDRPQRGQSPQVRDDRGGRPGPPPWAGMQRGGQASVGPRGPMMGGGPRFGDRPMGDRADGQRGGPSRRGGPRGERPADAPASPSDE